MDSILQPLAERPAHYIPQVAIALVAWAVLVAIGTVFYNIYLHPLRNFPGPFLARATNLWRTRKILTGDLPHTVRRLHEEYGPVVRISPFELSFVESQAWRDIYGHHGGAYEMTKDDRFYRPMGRQVPDSIVSADREHHGFLRRQLSHGFSERALRDQEPVFRHYVDLLMARLEEFARDGRPADMVAWFNFTTFDVIGNLAFGSDFGCLEKSYYHPWVRAITNNLNDLATMRAIIQFIPTSLVFRLFKLGVFKGRSEHMAYTKTRLRERMQLTEERPDFVKGLLKKKEVLSVEQIEINAQVLAVAGSETTATLLSGALFLLGKHPEVLRKLVHEVRTSFKSQDEIDLVSVNSLEYMLACINETFRLYPPTPLGLPRVVPKGGCKIAGHWIPQDTSVSVWQLAANYSSRNFAKPEEYHPERFLGAPAFAGDDLGAMQPFSVGPRNCIGRNLAYAEMRLILAKILFRFDVELAPEAGRWIEAQKVYSLWDKPPLPIYLKMAKTRS
ncbi:cytochrome p450 monooxygenase [Xylariaceae sp. FL0594]|nr:cytochrome p450 monooxygenase [Xylariaceae sp. FL0594]